MSPLLCAALESLDTSSPLPSESDVRDLMQSLDAMARASEADGLLAAAEADYDAAAAAARQAELSALAASVVGPASLAPLNTPAVLDAQARLRMRRAGLMVAVDLVGQARASLGLDDVGPYFR